LITPKNEIQKPTVKPGWFTYHINLQFMDDESGKYYFATVAEMPGCMSDGETPEKAMENIHEAMECWLMCQIECGDPIPQPMIESDFRANPAQKAKKTLKNQ
jgi:predicted RNase H-like HicB family nuclease